MMDPIIERLSQIDDRVAPAMADVQVTTPQGYVLRVAAGLHDPTRGRSSQMMAKSIDLLPPRPGDRVIELGTGSGFLALHMARAHSVHDIIATDINAEAVACASENLSNNKAPHVRVIMSDLFSSVSGPPANLILFNIPTHHPKLPNILGQLRGIGALWETTGQLKSRFLTEARLHLAPDGRIMMTFSRYADYDSLALLDTSGFDRHLLFMNRDEISEAGVLLLTPTST